MDRLVQTRQERLWHPEAHARDRWVKEHAAALPAGSQVLDAGAGASKYRPFFAHCAYRTQDFCAYAGDLVQYAQPIDHICEITNIPLPEGSLDAILCTEVIEHVTEPARVLAEFARLLRPGGKLLLTAPLLSALHMEPYHYYGGFTRYWYHHWLPRQGFIVDSITPVGGPALSCVIFARLFCEQWAKGEQALGPGRRLVSRPFRYLAKFIVCGVLARTLPRFDAWLGNEVVCSGYMVAATRSATIA